MTRNLAGWDRIARLGLGALLLVLAITGTIGVWGYIGVILVGTAFVSFCPLYRVLGMSTCKEC
jgi:hypothetical protein